MKKLIIKLLLITIVSISFNISSYAVTNEDIERAKVAAKNNDAKAQLYLGLLYYQGEGVKRDYGQSLKYFQLAADQGLAQAQFFLANQYYEGRGVRYNYEYAFKYFKLASDQGNRNATYQLGLMYQYGRGIKQSYAKAKSLYEKSCIGGSQLGCDAYNKVIKK